MPAKRTAKQQPRASEGPSDAAESAPVRKRAKKGEADAAEGEVAPAKAPKRQRLAAVAEEEAEGPVQHSSHLKVCLVITGSAHPACMR